jgi:Spy/CpxP family protein refolding chaperone
MIESKDGAIMKKAPITLKTIAAAAILVACVSARAQEPQPQPPPPDTVQPQQQQQMNPVEQMLGPLNITPDQAQQIRRIYGELRDERQSANMRLRLAQRALTEAIQSPEPNEALIGQRSKEVADAQSNTIRIRSLTEARILQVLTQEQRIKLRQLRAQANMNQRRNQQSNPRAQRRGGNALQPNQNRPLLTPQQQRRMLKQSPPQRPN